MKTAFLTGVLAALLSCQAFSQKLLIDTGTPEGQMLAGIEKETDAARKQAMLEEFAKTYPASTQIAWVSGQLQTLYLQAQQYDKVIETGEKALAADPKNLDAAYNNLKAAEAKNDVDGVIKWSAATSTAARAAEAAKPDDPDAKARIDYAKQVDTYSEYSIYAQSLKATEPARIIALVESLQQRNPESPYLNKSYGRYLNALRQAGQNDKAGAAAQKQAQRDPTGEDALLMAADYEMQRNAPDKSIGYAAKLAEVMQSKARPEDTSEADWQKKKDTLLGLAYWMQGVGYSNQHKFKEADKTLRQALPLIKNDNQLLAIGLFHLGVANYELAKTSKNKALMQDALKFSQQSAALKSPVQVQAQANVNAISKGVVRRPSAR